MPAVAAGAALGPRGHSEPYREWEKSFVALGGGSVNPIGVVEANPWTNCMNHNCMGYAPWVYLVVLLLCGLTPVTGQAASFSNPSSITIPDSGAGTPYPSTINVSGTAGTISQIVVTLNGYSHT